MYANALLLNLHTDSRVPNSLPHRTPVSMTLFFLK